MSLRRVLLTVLILADWAKTLNSQYPRLASLKIYKKNQCRREKSAERPGKPGNSEELASFRHIALLCIENAYVMRAIDGRRGWSPDATLKCASRADSVVSPHLVRPKRFSEPWLPQLVHSVRKRAFGAVQTTLRRRPAPIGPTSRASTPCRPLDKPSASGGQAPEPVSRQKFRRTR